MSIKKYIKWNLFYDKQILIIKEKIQLNEYGTYEIFKFRKF